MIKEIASKDKNFLHFQLDQILETDTVTTSDKLDTFENLEIVIEQRLSVIKMFRSQSTRWLSFEVAN